MNGGFNCIILAAIASPEQIREKAKEVLARPDYELENPQHSESLGLLTRLFLWFLEKIAAFFHLLDGLPDGLRWVIVIALTVLVVVLISHIILTFVRAFRGVPLRRSPKQQRELPAMPADLEQAAEEASARGDYIAAVRYLFAAAILRIERAQERPIRKGITNRELLRRYRATPLFEPLARFVAVIDAKWYGHDVCREEDFLSCRDEHTRIRGIAERSRHALRA